MKNAEAAPTAEYISLFRCDQCGGTNVERGELHWYDPNTGEDCDGQHAMPDTYCRDCEEDCGLTIEQVTADDLPADVAERARAEEIRAQVQAAAPEMLAALKAAQRALDMIPRTIISNDHRDPLRDSYAVASLVDAALRAAGCDR